MCYGCKPERFHTPSLPKLDRWWLAWNDTEKLRAVLLRLNELYRTGSPDHPWKHLSPKESDRRYDTMVDRMKKLDPTYEDLL